MPPRGAPTGELVALSLAANRELLTQLKAQQDEIRLLKAQQAEMREILRVHGALK